MVRGVAGVFIGLLVAAIIGVEVVIPIIVEGVASSNMSGTAATVFGLIPMFVALLLLVAMASPLMGRVVR
jgi:hypothetical protein